jgi:hypothetical protein
LTGLTLLWKIQRDPGGSKKKEAAMGRVGSLLFLLVVAHAFAGQGPSLSREGGSLVLRGLAPGEKAALVAAGLAVQGVLARVRFEKLVAQAEGAEGSVRWQLPGEVPDEALFLALPYGGGAPLALSGLRPGGKLSLVPKRAAIVFQEAEAHPSLVVACVARPKEALYCLLSADGSSLDGDGAEDGSQVWDVSAFASVDEGKRLDELRPGDHIFAAELRGGTLAHTIVGGN